MPSYINPKYVHVEPRGRNPLPAVIVLAVIGYATYRVAEWLASILVAILAVMSVVAAAGVVTTVVVLRRQRGRAHLGASPWVTQRLSASSTQSRHQLPARQPAAVPAPSRPAIPAPAIHYHLHLHGTCDSVTATPPDLQRIAAHLSSDQAKSDQC